MGNLKGCIDILDRIVEQCMLNQSSGYHFLWHISYDVLHGVLYGVLWCVLYSRVARKIV